LSFISKLKSKKVLIPLILIVVTGSGIAFLIKSMNSPAEGTVGVTSQSNSVEPPATPKKLGGKYVAFEYPSRYERIAKNNPSASLEHWTLYGRQALGPGPSAQISVIVAKMPAGGVKEDGAYKLYAAFPDKYKLTKMTQDNEEVIIGTANGEEYIRTALWGHKDYLLTVAISSNQENEQLVTEMNALLESVEWK